MQDAYSLLGVAFTFTVKVNGGSVSLGVIFYGKPNDVNHLRYDLFFVFGLAFCNRPVFHRQNTNISGLL